MSKRGLILVLALGAIGAAAMTGAQAARAVNPQASGAPAGGGLYANSYAVVRRARRSAGGGRAGARVR